MPHVLSISTADRTTCTRAIAFLIPGILVVSRQALWTEPIYRGVFGLLREFGEAEIASLISPRGVVIEHSAGPDVKGPPATGADRRQCPAPGRLVPPEFNSVANEVKRARKLVTSPVGQADRSDRPDRRRRESG